MLGYNGKNKWLFVVLGVVAIAFLVQMIRTFVYHRAVKQAKVDAAPVFEKMRTMMKDKNVTVKINNTSPIVSSHASQEPNHPQSNANIPNRPSSKGQIIEPTAVYSQPQRDQKNSTLNVVSNDLSSPDKESKPQAVSNSEIAPKVELNESAANKLPERSRMPANTVNLLEMPVCSLEAFRKLRAAEDTISEDEWNCALSKTDLRIYAVRDGDSLSLISMELFGYYDYWTKIWALNPEIENPHNLSTGKQLIFNSPDLDD